MGKLRIAGVAILAFGVSLGAARAQDGDHPIEARGLTSGDMVSVSPFSAALGIAVPIGQAYDVGPSMSYGLTAIYNANIWDFDVVCTVIPETGSEVCTPYASPSRSSELGLGWTIGLGRLIPPGHEDNPGTRWLYLAPDGSSHAFFSTLHEGETPVSGWKYARDGSYLRMYTNGGSVRWVDFPNGVRHKFAWTGPFDTFLTAMEDQYGNWVDVYHTSSSWKITDSRGREHFVRFGDDAEIGKYVTQVELDGIGGQTRYWTFDYAWRWVSRTCRVSSGSSKYYVPLLRAINGPEGIAYQIKRDDNGGPDYELGNTSASCSDISGVPKSFRLPTKGKYTFTWALWDFPSSTEGSHKESAVGINTVTNYDPYSGQSATTTYSVADYAYESRTTVTSPTGVKTIHYFTLPWNCSDCQRDWTFGLPYTVNQSTVADGTTLYLSTETKGPSNEPLSSTWVRFTRDYFTNGPHSAPFDWRMQSNRRLRMSRTYEGALADGRYRQTKVDTTTFDGAGHHRKTTTTSYFGPTPAEQPNSVSIVNYNPGSSCANPEASGCTYQLPSTSSRWILGRFDYTQIENTVGGDRARTDYAFDSSTGFLNEVRTRKSEGATQNADIRVRYTPNADGTIAREEWFGGDNGNQTTPTYALGYVYANGLLTEARYLDPTNFSSVLMSLGQTVRDPYTGVALTQTDPNGLQATYSYDSLLRPTLEQDTSPASIRLGWTSYEYAFSGTGLGSTNLVRTKSSSPSLCPSGPASCFSYHGQSESYLDGFGRSVSQRVERAPGVWSMRYDVYDAFGRLTAASAWGADGTGGGETQYQNFDVYGRPQTILAPDAGTNPDHVVDIAYTGSRQTVTTTRIGTTFSGPETPFSTTRKFDPFGRLIEIVDPVTTTKYSYSTTGQLLTIVQSAGGASQTRSFQYADDRGFLTQETHPEKGATGNGSIFYKSYDARGHLLAKRDGVDNPSAEVTFVYDSLERLRQVATAGTLARRFTYDELSGGTYRLGQLTTAEAWNTFGAYSGSVTVTERYVYEGRAGAVSQKTTHLNINGADKGTFTQNFTWTDAGQLASETYPSWTLAPSAPARTINYGYNYGQLTSISGFAPSITYHDNFALASIAHSNGVTDWIAKDPYGLGRPSEIHTSGVLGGQNWSTGAYVYDGTGNIRGMGGDRFRYDGVSRLVGTQLQLPELASPTNSFDDGFERSTACNWDYRTPDPGCDGVVRREAEQQTGFDAFGNLTSTTTEGTTLSIPASTQTNRLTSATYDDRGNATSWNANNYDYGLLNEQRRFQSGSQHWLHAFSPAGERLVSMSVPVENDGPIKLTLRGLGAEVLRQFRLESLSVTPEWTRDWIHGPAGVLAAATPDAGSTSGESGSHFTLDHLGSPRVVTDDFGVKVAEHTYWPFGSEATTFDQDDRALKFTGHERDLNDGSSQADDVDYMHARSFHPLMGRFHQTDPGALALLGPRTLNQYSYVGGNPLTRTDPTGAFVLFVQSWQVTDKPLALEGEYTDTGFGSIFAQRGIGGWRRPGVKVGGNDGDDEGDGEEESEDGGGDDEDQKKDPCSWQRNNSLTGVLRRLSTEFLDEMVGPFSVEARLPAWPIPLLAGLGPSISITHGRDKSLAVQGAFGFHAGSAVKVGSASSNLGVPIWSGRGEVPARGIQFKGSLTVGLGPALAIDAYSSPGSATVEVTGGAGANAFVGASATGYVLESAERDPCR